MVMKTGQGDKGSEEIGAHQSKRPLSSGGEDNINAKDVGTSQSMTPSITPATPMPEKGRRRSKRLENSTAKAPSEPVHTKDLLAQLPKRRGRPPSHQGKAKPAKDIQEPRTRRARIMRPNKDLDDFNSDPVAPVSNPVSGPASHTRSRSLREAIMDQGRKLEASPSVTRTLPAPASASVQPKVRRDRKLRAEQSGEEEVDNPVVNASTSAPAKATRQRRERKLRVLEDDVEGESTSNVVVNTPTVAPVKRPRGRPPKRV